MNDDYKTCSMSDNIFGALGSTTQEMSKEDKDIIKQNIEHYLEKTIIHLGECGMGLECYLKFNSKKGDIYNFNFYEESSHGYCPWGRDEMLFEIDGEVYLSCNVNNKCEKCDGTNIGEHEFHHVSLKLPGSHVGADFVHRFDGFDGIDIHEEGISFPLSWVHEIQNANEKVPLVRIEDTDIPDNVMWKDSKLRTLNQCTMFHNC